MSPLVKTALRQAAEVIIEVAATQVAEAVINKRKNRLKAETEKSNVVAITTKQLKKENYV